ncbi:DoxX family protein [Jatrophihabitans sp. YIM 134969]
MTREPERRATSVLSWALGILLLVTGTDHFLSPSGFEAIVPRALGSPAFWVAASGVAELLVAVGLLVRPTRRLAALAAVVLFVVVFPANVQMALDSGDGTPGWTHVPWVAWARLPLQIPLIVWAGWIAATTSSTVWPVRRRPVER